MAAADLKPATWVAFSRKRDLEDAQLLRALTTLDKLDESRHDDRLAALEQIVEHARKMIAALPKRKPPLPDKEAKEIKDKLYSVHDEAERLQKTVRDVAASNDSADEEDSPALLTTKMVPLLRALRKPDTRMHALIANASKECAVLIMRKPVPVSRRKLLTEYLAAEGSVKPLVAECGYENNVLTFVVQGSAGGLAKKLRAALLKQTELRLKVRVRGDDGDDEDGEEGEDIVAGTEGESQGKIPEAPPLPGSAAAEFQRRRRRLQPMIDEALANQHPEATKLRALLGFVSDKADEQQDYAAASKGLDQLEKLLETIPEADERRAAGGAEAFTARLTAILDRIKAAAASGHPNAAMARERAGEAGPFARKANWLAAHHLLDLTEALLSARAEGGSEGGGSKSVSAPKIVYTQSRLAWGATRKKVGAELAKLEKVILDTYKDHRALADVAKGVRKLDTVLQKFDQSLEDKLDAALNATDEEEKLRWHEEAREVIATYQGYLKSDPIVRELDNNPFVPISVQATLTTTLSTLASKIA